MKGTIYKNGLKGATQVNKGWESTLSDAIPKLWFVFY